MAAVVEDDKGARHEPGRQHAQRHRKPQRDLHAAQRQVEELGRLLDAAPALKPQIAAAEWVGNRRWNLKFKTGQLLALPEGEDEAASAFVKFARMDGQNRLIGGKVASFDMRDPPRIYMRVPGRADEVKTLAEVSE